MTTPFEDTYHRLLHDVMRNGVEVEVGEWQSQDVRMNPDMVRRDQMGDRFLYPTMVFGMSTGTSWMW